MKKFLFLLAAALMLVGTTSCLDSNDDDQKATMRAVMTNRAIAETGDPVLSLANYSIEVNYTQATLNISGAVKLADGSTVQFITTDMAMSQVSGTSAFNFSAPQASSGNVSSLNGTFDVATGLLYLAFRSGSSTVYATSGISMPYATTAVVDTTAGSQPTTSTKQGYFFSVNPETMKGTLTITNYGSTATTSSNISFTATGLAVKPSYEGYTLTADALAGNSSYGSDTLRNVQATVTNGGQTLNMTYQNRNNRVTVRGTMFSQSN